MKQRKRMFGKHDVFEVQIRAFGGETGFMLVETGAQVHATPVRSDGHYEVNTPPPGMDPQIWYEGHARKRAPQEADYYEIVPPTGNPNGHALIQYFKRRTD